MLICRNAEKIDGQRKVGNPCSRVITKLFKKTMQTLTAKLSKGGTRGISEKRVPRRFQNLWILLKLKENVVISSNLNFFQHSGIFRTVLCFSYLQTQLTKIR